MRPPLLSGRKTAPLASRITLTHAGTGTVGKRFPFPTKLIGCCDRPVLGLLIRCGRRRTELVSLDDVESGQLRDSRWVIPDFFQHYRTVYLRL